MAVERLTFEMNAVGNAVPEMKRVQGQLQQIDRTMTRSTRAMRAQTGGLTRMTRGFGLLGLQVQDVAVQASMGTDAMRIFSMQGPQILSLFGPLGMIAGAVAGVGAGILMANGAASDFSFDFQKFATDMAPLLDNLRPAIEIIGKAFRFVGGLAVDAFNGLLNGVNRAAVFISHLPDIVREAGRRIGIRVDLIRNSFDQMTNQVQYLFANAMSTIVQNVAGTANSINETLNSAFNLGLPTDIGANMIEALDKVLDESNTALGAMQSEAQVLQDALDQPNQALEAMRQELENITGIDIRDYFGKAAEAAGGDGGGGGLAGALTEAQQRMQDVSDTMKTSFEDGIMSITDGTKTIKDAFKAMARDVIAQLYRVYVVQRLVGGFDAKTKTGTGIVGAIAGALFRAQGGAVSANRPYIVGEKGPEMLVPSTSGRVIPNNQLGGGGQTVVVNQTINVSTGVQQTVRTEIKQLMPQIAESAKQAVVDAKRRGGSYGRAFA